jgi:hypothetical protein
VCRMKDAATGGVGHRNLISNFHRHLQVFHIVDDDGAFEHNASRIHDDFHTMRGTGLRFRPLLLVQTPIPSLGEGEEVSF